MLFTGCVIEYAARELVGGTFDPDVRIVFHRTDTFLVLSADATRHRSNEVLVGIVSLTLQPGHRLMFTDRNFVVTSERSL